MPVRNVRRVRHRTEFLRRAVSDCAELLDGRLLLSSYTVTSAADSGPGTLRDVIANFSAGTIAFAVDSPIRLNSQLEIARKLTISGPGAGSLSSSLSTRT